VRVVWDEVCKWSRCGCRGVTRKGVIVDACGPEKGHVRLCLIMGRFPLLSCGLNERFP
jgi:hypothetical protein